MKKIFTFIFAIALSFNMLGQCPLTTAVDFTATDCHGTEVHLFDILDGGQYVLMDFFFTTCGPCQQATPKVVESYYSFGCNMYDVFYIEVSVSDGDAACQNWAANYGVEYPTISTAGGGATICNSLYQIGQYPTVILIAPDHSILIQDLWPIGSAQAVINALTPYGIQQHDCTAPGVEEVLFSSDTIFVSTVYEPEGEVIEPFILTIINATLSDLQIQEYLYEGVAINCYDGDIEVGNDITGMTIAPNESLDVWVYAWQFDSDEIIDGKLTFMTSFDTYELPVVYEWFMNADETSFEDVVIYPNPANDFIKINGQNLGNVSVYNAFGQVIYETTAVDDLTINTSNFENGVYFVKVGEKAMRFVVVH